MLLLVVLSQNANPSHCCLSKVKLSHVPSVQHGLHKKQYKTRSWVQDWCIMQWTAYRLGVRRDDGQHSSGVHDDYSMVLQASW